MIKKIILNKEHVVWVFTQQFLARGLVAIKFLILARILGPESIGLIGVALVSLALVEALTDIGINQAVIQDKNELDKAKINVLWTFQFVRGIVIFIILITINPLLVQIFETPEALTLLNIVAIVPIFKNSVSIGVILRTRSRNYRFVSLLQLVTTVTDLLFSLILVFYLESPIGAILGILISEIVRSFLSHICDKSVPKLNFNFKSVQNIISYGKWIWANSISSFFFNQLDKLLATKFLGTTLLGYYQMSQKITQLLITDISFALSQYLFPTFSKLNRDNDKSVFYIFKLTFDLLIVFSFFISTYFIINADLIITIVLGEVWLVMIPIMKLMVVSSGLAAILNISIILIRALGYPKKVTKVSYIQLILFSILSIAGITYFGVNGLITASIISLCVTNLILFRFIKEQKKGIEIPNESIILNVPNILVYTSLIACLFIRNDYYLLIASSLTFSIYLLVNYRYVKILLKLTKR